MPVSEAPSFVNSGSEDAGTFSYTYDPSGNLSFDSRNVLDIRSNVLNLPGRIGTMGGTMTYTYLGDGTKVAAVVNLSAPASTSTDNVILEQNISGMDLGLLDFGARFYDPFTTRWNAVDPLAILYCQTTPFQYCLNNPIKYVDPFGLWTMDDNGYAIAEKEDNLNSFAKFMNVSPQYAYDLLFDQGIDPMNIIEGTIFNTETYNGSISPSYCSSHQSENTYSWGNWFSFCMSSIENSNPFSSSDTKFRVKNSKGEFSFKAYNDTFYSNQYITKDMLHPVKPITCTLQWLGRFGNAVSLTHFSIYTNQAIHAENPEDRICAIVDAVNSGIGLIPGYGPAIVSLLGGSNNIKLYLNYSAPVFSSNPFFCPLR